MSELARHTDGRLPMRAWLETRIAWLDGVERDDGPLSLEAEGMRSGWKYALKHLEKIEAALPASRPVEDGERADDKDRTSDAFDMAANALGKMLRYLNNDRGSVERGRIIDEALHSLRNLRGMHDELRSLIAEPIASRPVEDGEGEPPREPLGTCVVHGDYWTPDCYRCYPPAPEGDTDRQAEALAKATGAVRKEPPPGVAEIARAYGIDMKPQSDVRSGTSQPEGDTEEQEPAAGSPTNQEGNHG